MFTHGNGARWGITVLLNESESPMTRKRVSLIEPVMQNDSSNSGRDSEKWFHFVLMELFDRAEEGWNETLEAINDSAGLTLNDFSSDQLKDQLMFDRSFQRSRDYFTALQLLRLVDKWTDENVAALEKLASKWQLQLFNATSLREATRGTSLNMTLYLFTVVTIIYAPIGFLAVSTL
ncbi:hypothetical protein F5X68DRAFT_192728 [Plectosphaerella plurivora]|uniref:Uncharacterized protein n=1 Tax=Plectosphaerella plurivora TaxID=936078 RepID=A0A9P9A9Z7_9PEZI|nr:hypothetical protein F5X68DRAFT_192728 [Plectosphaerella plurivora]